jgi:hypothetical protein
VHIFCFWTCLASFLNIWESMPLVLLNIVMVKKGMCLTLCVCCVYLFNCVVQQEELWSVSSVNEEVKEESADEHQ